MKLAYLCHITFTGIDARTDFRALHEIQREFPIAEFGVLVSNNWKENGNRFFDTPIRVLDHPGHKVGYAGGFTPDNVGDKLSYLLEQDTNDFWIDMETGVRTEGWFDLNKVVKVLQICKLVLDDHRKGGKQ